MAYDYIKRGKAEENGYTNTKVFKMFGISKTEIRAETQTPAAAKPTMICPQLSPKSP